MRLGFLFLLQIDVEMEKTITKIFELNFSVNHNIHFAVDIYISKDDKNRNGVTNDAYH